MLLPWKCNWKTNHDTIYAIIDQKDSRVLYYIYLCLCLHNKYIYTMTRPKIKYTLANQLNGHVYEIHHEACVHISLSYLM